jgi:hypothetical protein
VSADRRAGALRLLDGGKGRAPRSSRPVSAPRVIAGQQPGAEPESVSLLRELITVCGPDSPQVKNIALQKL